MSELLWSSLAEELLRCGWGTLTNLESDQLGCELHELRRNALRQFSDLMRCGGLGDSATPTGQYGLTVETDEGDLGLKEIRGHYVFNLAVPPANPLTVYRPWFYGGEVALPDAAAEFGSTAGRLHELLDYMTLRALETVELAAGLDFGALAAPLALGERLLRFQWYPEIREGRPAWFAVETARGVARIRGQLVGAERIVRASPHIDTGHWTWQVLASDDALRFLDPAAGQPVHSPGGASLTGNACDFLELEHPQLIAPVHWVDMKDAAASRASISYFAHARPGAIVKGRRAGERLYVRLMEMGYVSEPTLVHVRKLLDRVDGGDREVVAACLEREWAGTDAPPAGFAAGISRYYQDGDTRRPHPRGLLACRPMITPEG